MDIKKEAQILKLTSPKLAAQTEEVRNRALKAAADALLANKEDIINANKEDMDAAEKSGLAAPTLKRLKFDEGKLNDVVKGIMDLIELPDPLRKIQLKRELDEGLILYRETCPIGVIGVIFEARPDALVQISSLCIKSGNCVILKGGSEALKTNRILFQTIYKAVVDAGIPEGCMLQLEARDEIKELLSCHEYVDLIIPRGSNSFVQYIMENTKIPVMGHADGICHVYVDKDADIDKAVKIVVDSKTQYVAVCNAVETLLVHKDIAEKFMPVLYKALKEKNVEVRATEDIRKIIDCDAVSEEDYKTEYLDYIISIKTVENVEEAVDHINRYGSHHTDSIVTENDETAEYFMQMTDSANVYRNCSTRFADGYRYGFGAEVGISTGKLHARGPVGLEGLVTYKYKLYGDGHIVADYAEGRRSFNFRDLK